MNGLFSGISFACRSVLMDRFVFLPHYSLLIGLSFLLGYLFFFLSTRPFLMQNPKLFTLRCVYFGVDHRTRWLCIYHVCRNKRPPKTVIFHRGEYTKPMDFDGWFFKGRSTQNRWLVMGDFSKGGVHKTDRFWWVLEFSLLLLKSKRLGCLFRQRWYILVRKVGSQCLSIGGPHYQPWLRIGLNFFPFMTQGWGRGVSHRCREGATCLYAAQSLTRGALSKPAAHSASLALYNASRRRRFRGSFFISRALQRNGIIHEEKSNSNGKSTRLPKND